MRNYYNGQRGGTAIGIIIGLIIGLGIALAVALAVTKTPMPFTNKISKQERASRDASENFDPNKPLYGNKAPAKDAARSFARETDNSQPPVTGVSVPDTLKKPEPKAAEVKISDAKKDAAAKPAAAEDNWNYFLQAGAFREVTDAENTRAKLALMGIEARVSERQSEAGTLYRVRVGPFGELESMNVVRGKLSDNGVDVAVVRISK